MAVLTLHQAFELALQHHQAGRLAQAETMYRQILAVDPQHGESLHLLGVIASQANRNDVAADLIRQAIALRPGEPAFHYNLGYALREQGLVDEAMAEYRRAIQLQPGYAEAHNNLGNALQTQGRHEESMAEYQLAIHFQPEYAEAHNNLGNAFRENGVYHEAIAAYHRALRINPEYRDAYVNLAGALNEIGEFQSSLVSYSHALECQPHSPEIHHAMGVVLSEQRMFEGAIFSYRRGLALRPDFAETWYNLGVALTGLGRSRDATAAFRRALEIQPDFAECSNNLGNALKDQGQVDAAIAAYREAFRINPSFAKAHSNLLLSLHYPSNPDIQSIFEEHRRWDEAHAQPLERHAEPHTNSPDPERRLRVGYVSPDFREHSVAAFVEGLLNGHNPTEMEVFCYDDALTGDSVTARLQDGVENWRKIRSLTDAQAVDLIRNDRIDILVDLAGHTADNRLLVFARQPAPVQVTYLGYGDTTGMKAMDYRITDALADPPGTSELLHAEELVRIPGGAWCFRSPNNSPPVNAAPALDSNQITFGCFNALPKITAATLEAWSRILQAVPGSRLLLKNLGFRDPAAGLRMRLLLKRAGIDLRRVDIASPVPSLRDHLASYRKMNIALDTFPYNGTKTTCEALWMGVPVITLRGQSHTARVGASLLGHLGLPQFIASHVEQYIEIAVGLGANKPVLAELRSTLRGRMASSPLMDAARLTRHVEDAYRRMWRTWCARRTPQI